jgi:chemotaxis protein MotB
MKKRYKNINTPPQPKLKEILSWVEDGPDKLEYDTTGEHEWTEAVPPEKPFPSALKSTVGGSSDLVFPGDEDVFHHRRMPRTPHWSIPWSDLMMTMFILFAVLYIYHSAKREFLTSEGIGTDFNLGPKSAAALNNADTSFDDSPTIPKLYDLSKKTLRARHLNNFASVDLIADRAVRIMLTGDLLFDAGKTELKPEAREKLSEIASIIKKTPFMVNVVGHADNVPIHSAPFPSNWELSVVRACAVARFFIEEMKVPARKFYLSGHSYFQPVRSNDTAENRAANRRVEIIITRERPYGTPTSLENIPGISYNKGFLPSSVSG